MSKEQGYAISFTAYQTAELIEAAPEARSLAPDEIEGQTLASLVSPGTELNAGYCGPQFPVHRTGYAAVMRVTAVGTDVHDLQVGERVFAMAPHQSHQRVARSAVIPVPTSLPAEQAVFARLMGVSMTTLLTTKARPGSTVLVTGLGPVGNLAAQVFAACGYNVVGVDPVEARRRIAQEVGLTSLFAEVPAEDPAVAGRVCLAVECSGHEQAVLDACRVVKKGGEVVLIGVPWRKRSDLPAFEVLHAIFHRYVHVRSGWEWELPLHPTNFAPGSIFENLGTALTWLVAGRVRVEPLGVRMNPRDAQEAYQTLLHQRGDKPVVVSDWTA